MPFLQIRRNFDFVPRDIFQALDQGRTIVGLLQSCIAVGSLCTWVVLHPNVPESRSQSQSQSDASRDTLKPFLERWRDKIPWEDFRMMGIALIAPEAMFALALRQYGAARYFHKAHKLSMTHGFFIVMGGFVTKDGRHPITTKSLADDYAAAIKQIDEQDIADKSKDDILGKIITLLQLFAFIATYCARVKEGLQISALETSTLGLALIQCLTGFLWLNKPQRVSQAIPLDSPIDQEWEKQSMLDPESIDSSTHEGNIVCSSLDAIGKTLNGVLFGRYPDFKPLRESRVPRFWSGDLEDNLHLFSQLVCASVLGCVHLLAWSTHSTFFPSLTEMWLWRVSALMLAISPILCVTLLLIKNGFTAGSIPRVLLAYLTYGVAALYIIARGALLILCLTTLRGAPPELLVSVDWRSLFH
ncbi:hypothetical protein MSAN_01216000 [Mycena sanguinolenta]|uniref:Uncharacterized protein n=1 Tax=Mycena sanguinolenta TaxID=230812 RepID=A0A8H6YCW8_9AGAR|nr:hypothetical protein MSAN_01216000 [Mycena sanguinolenta]